MRQTGVGGVWKCGKRRGLVRVWRGGFDGYPKIGQLGVVTVVEKCGES